MQLSCVHKFLSIASPLVGQLLVPESLWFIARDSLSLASLLFIGVKISFAPVNISVPFERQDMGCDSVKEPAVVSNYHYAADEIEDRFFECPQGIDVEVVGGFVE